MDNQPIEVSEDALKLMVAEHGVRGTARLLGMDDRQRDAFRQRVTRGKWLHDPHIAAMRAKASPTSPFTPVVANMSPTAAVHAEIQALGAKTRLGHAKAAAAIAEHVATRDADENLLDMQNVKAAGQHADLVYAWKDSAPQVRIRLDVLSTQSEQPVFEVESECVSSWDSEDSTDPDNY